MCGAPRSGQRVWNTCTPSRVHIPEVLSALLAISNNVGVVKYCFCFFLNFFCLASIFRGTLTLFAPRERCLATAENLVSRERSQGRVRRFWPDRSSQTLDAADGSPPWTPDEARASSCSATLRFGCGLLADLTACHHPQGSPCNLSGTSVRPNHLSGQNIDHDYYFKLPHFREGAGRSINRAVIYFTPWPVTSCPVCEPNCKTC
jgi:hypothetical protein